VKAETLIDRLSSGVFTRVDRFFEWTHSQTALFKRRLIHC